MTNKYRILFPVPAIYGHLAPSLAIAKQLVANGHTIGYCSGSSGKKMIANAGVHNYYSRDIYQAYAEELIVAGTYEFGYKSVKVFKPEALRQSFQELLKAFESFNPDVVYIDTMDFLSVAVAEKLNLPYAHGSATVLFYPEKGIPPMGTGWNINTPILNRFKLIPYLSITMPLLLKVFLNCKKAMKQIDPTWTSNSFTNISPYLFMLFSTDLVEYPRPVFIPQVFYLGPSILEPDETQLPDFPWDRLDKKRPIVYIATGTLFPDSYKNFYRNTLIALAEENFPFPIQVVMAIGRNKSPESFGKIPSNFIVVPYAPQIKLLPIASVVVTHGGVNSVNETLNFGKPMLVVHMGGDRIDMAARIAYRNAGIRLHAKKATAGRIKDAIIRLIKDPEYTQAAKKIMHSYKKCDAPKTAADLLIRLAETRKPILRRKNAPITFENTNSLTADLETEQ